MVSKITTPPSQVDLVDKVNEIIDDKQDTLVSGTNIKTINNTSILGSGNISITAQTSWGSITGTLSDQTDLKNALDAKYDASNPNGYTSNVGTVTSVNNVSPVNGNVSLSIPSVPLEGVQINGTDLTITNKKVNIPLAGTNTIGVAKANAAYGVYNNSGTLTISKATDAQVTAKTNQYRPLVPYNIDLAVKTGITTNTLTLTDAEKTSAKNWLGISEGGSVDVDNKSITTNSSDEIQTIGVINSRDSSTAVKTWTGTKAQYDAIVTKDPNTLYNITDDTDVTLTILEALYPVGSVYITTANTCPLSTLISGSTWELVSSGIVKSGEVPVKGNGMTLGLTNGVDYAGITNTSTNSVMQSKTSSYGVNVSTSLTVPGSDVKGYLGVTTDPTKSGIIADTSSLTLSVNIFERTA